MLPAPAALLAALLLVPPADAAPGARAGGRAGTPAAATKVSTATTATAPRAPVVARIVGAPRAPAADSVLVEKALRRLTVYAGGLPVRTYTVALGRNPVGAKERAGYFRTPEGLYYIDARNAASGFHRALHLSYPNAADRARARALGVEPGGAVMIHGLPNGRGGVGAAHLAQDWTFGCVALTDEAVDELWAAVPVGTPVRITP